MRIALGADHRGCSVKDRLIELLTRLGHQPEDLGTFNEQSIDYPAIAAVVARRVASGAAERGILVCGSGIGMAIAANKVPGVRASPCHDEFSAEMSRRHNNLNVLCLSADRLAAEATDRIVQLWLTTEFEGGRHARRLDQIAAIEKQSCSPEPPR